MLYSSNFINNFLYLTDSKQGTHKKSHGSGVTKFTVLLYIEIHVRDINFYIKAYSHPVFFNRSDIPYCGH